MTEDDFYATIKFKSGEEIFALVGYSEEEDRTFLLLESPIVIEKVKNRGGIQGFRVEPWLKTTKDDLFVVNMEDVLTLSESKDFLASLIVDIYPIFLFNFLCGLNN